VLLLWPERLELLQLEWWFLLLLLLLLLPLVPVRLLLLLLLLLLMPLVLLLLQRLRVSLLPPLHHPQLMRKHLHQHVQLLRRTPVLCPTESEEQRNHFLCGHASCRSPGHTAPGWRKRRGGGGCCRRCCGWW